MGPGRGAEESPGRARRSREAAVSAVAARDSARDREEEGREEAASEDDIVTIIDVEDEETD